MRKKIKEYYDTKIDLQMQELIGTENNPPF